MGFFKGLWNAVTEPDKRPESDGVVWDDVVWSSAGYQVCSHSGCQKKVRTEESGHPCCGTVRHHY